MATVHEPTRREALRMMLATSALAVAPAHGLAGPNSGSHAQVDPLRAINIMNFIRAEEPREAMDLFLPVREQMESIKAHGFPATWLLQYDAVVEGPFLRYLQEQMPPSHEIGLWFEINRKLCDAAGIAWRGNPAWEWDYHVPVAYSIGYEPDQRRRLADAAMRNFRRIVGHYPRTVASWNLDAVTLAHLTEHYPVEAFGNCRDQLATDGFTIWGAPIAAYYPSRVNAWSCAIDRKNQLPVPVFRLLGQDPVYYYDKTFPYPDTMEPVWPSGRSVTFVEHFLDMIAQAPTGDFAYAQLGQENSFGWPEMQQAYGMQLDKLHAVVNSGGPMVETMSATGRRFRQRFDQTPVQMQIMLEDPYGRTDPPERTIWYQSRFYRANLHFRGDTVFLRDLFVYSDRFPQIYLHDTAMQHGIDQIGLAVLDGYHWSKGNPARDSGQAHAVFMLGSDNNQGEPLRIAGMPTVEESGSDLLARVPLTHDITLLATFSEQTLTLRFADAPAGKSLALDFRWERERTAFESLAGRTMQYRYRDFAYSVQIDRGAGVETDRGVRILAHDNGIVLHLAQQA